MRFADFKSENWHCWLVGSNTLCKFNKVQRYSAHVWFSFINLSLIYAFICNLQCFKILKELKDVLI